MVNVNKHSDQFIKNSLTGETIYLTKREYQILSCLLAHKSNKVIAKLFDCSPRTIEGHVSRIIAKFDISSRDEISSMINSFDIDKLKKQYIQLTGDSFENIKNIYYIKYFLHKLKGKFFLLFIFFIFILSFFIYFKNVDQSVGLSSDFLIPPKDLLLPRQELIKKIEEAKSQNDRVSVVALLGIAGSGKTVLARSYAKNAQQQIVWEINALTERTLVNSFENLAYVLAQSNDEVSLLNALQKVSPDIKKAKIISYIKKNLKNSSGWILIFDNISDVKLLEHFLPNHFSSWGKGLVLITTRNAQIRDLVFHKNIKIIDMPELNDHEKKTLLLNLLGSEFVPPFSEVFEKDISHIPSYPMDIMLAGNVLKGSHMILGDYFANLMKEYSEKGRPDLAGNLSRRYMVGVILDRLRPLEDYVTLLNTISMFEGACPPLDFLHFSFGKKNIDNFVYTLRKNSLISFENNSRGYFGRRVCLNESVYASIKSWLLKRGYAQQKMTERFFSLIEVYVNKALEEEIYFKIRNMLEAVEKINPIKDIKDLERQKRFYFLLGKMYDFVGDYNRAINALKKSHSINISSKKISNFEIIKKMGDVYRQFDDFDRSTSLYKEVIQILKKQGGSVRLGDIISDLGNTYKGIGEYQKAKEQYLRALKIYHNSKAPCEMAFAKARIGNLYSLLGDFKKAKYFLKEALEFYIEKYGADHPKTSWVQTNLAYVYIETGFFNLAETLLLKSLSTRRKHFGDHPKTAWVLANLGRLKVYMNQHKVGEAYLLKSRGIYVQTYGLQHTFSVRLLGYLCELDLSLKNYEKAKERSLEVFDSFSKMYGKQHSKTAWALFLMAKAHLGLNQEEKALSQFARSIKIFRKNDHVDLYLGEVALGDFYDIKIKMPQKAKTHYRSALSILRKKFPEDSPIVTSLEKKLL